MHADWNILWHRPILPAQEGAVRNAAETLVGFFTEDLEALEQEAVCTPEFGNGRMFYYYMKEGTSNASAGVGWRIYLGRIIEKAVIINYSYLAKNCRFNHNVKG